MIIKICFNITRIEILHFGLFLCFLRKCNKKKFAHADRQPNTVNSHIIPFVISLNLCYLNVFVYSIKLFTVNEQNYIFDMNISMCVPAQNTSCSLTVVLPIYYCRSNVFSIILFDGKAVKMEGVQVRTCTLLQDRFNTIKRGWARLCWPVIFYSLFILSFFVNPIAILLLLQFVEKKPPFMLNRDGIHEPSLSSHLDF